MNPQPHALLYGTIILAAFLALVALMVWDVFRKFDAAQREVELDELWGDAEDELEVAA